MRVFCALCVLCGFLDLFGQGPIKMLSSATNYRTTLPGIGMLAAETTRASAYLQVMLSRGMQPSFIVLMKNPDKDLKPGQVRRTDMKAGKCSFANVEFDPSQGIEDIMADAGIPHVDILSLDPNSSAITAELSKLPEQIFIYAGVGGVILRTSAFNTGKRFLHVHPGIVPRFRGSTPIYYSILAENTIGATAMFLNAGIDTGSVLATREFPVPEDRRNIDHCIDPLLRASLLADVLQAYQGAGRFEERPQPPGSGETYYIIHPVLKHIAILGRKQ